jgi:predicted alpha/beta superfamily hydrolase
MNALHQISRNRQVRISTFSISVLLFVIFFVPGYAQVQDAASVPPQVAIAGTQLLKITSTICNQEYVLCINLPRGYGDTTKTFPVLFLLDAQWDFPLVQAIYGEQYYDGFIPGIVLVGITWGGKDPDYDKLRARDLTPTDISNAGQYGNAQNFLAFIKKELIPFVESKYRIKKDDRALVGSSFGGLFTLYTMFHEPEIFTRCVLTSPALGWDNEILYTYNKNYSEKKKELSAKVFMGIGEYENVPDFQKFASQFKEKNYKGIELQTKILEGMGHSGGKAEGYARGLQFVYAKPTVNIESKVLDQYVGEYEINPQYLVKLEREGDRLVGTAPGSPKATLYAETEKDFYVKGLYLFLHFQKDNAGKVTGFQVEQYSGGVFAKKVK